MQASLRAPYLRSVETFAHDLPVRTPATVRFAGILDASTADSFRERIEAIVASGFRNVVIDLGGVTLLDSVGVRLLVSFHERVTTQGGKVAVINAADQPLFVLELLRSKKGFAL